MLRSRLENVALHLRWHSICLHILAALRNNLSAREIQALIITQKGYRIQFVNKYLDSFIAKQSFVIRTVLLFPIFFSGMFILYDPALNEQYFD